MGAPLVPGSSGGLGDASGESVAHPGERWLDRYAAAVLGTYGRPSRVLVRGQGAWVWDADGRRYLDLLAGIATTLLGHAHPLLASAVASQMSTLGHVSNFFAHPLQVTLAERLLGVAGAGEGGRVFFCNSGAEANEAAFKIARRTGRPRIVAALGGFHGRTMGALALTAKREYREPFAPLPPGVEHVPFGDLDAMAAALREGIGGSVGEVAAVVLEPVQGEGGVHPAPPGYLREVRRLTREHGALLILDEVQCGMGRTGHWLAHQAPHHLGDAMREDPAAAPDVVTMAKGLGGGVPIGAAVTYSSEVTALLGPGQHGTTFGGNPLAAAAALATVHVVESEGLLARARAAGERVTGGVLALGHPLVRDVRGEGLLLAIQLATPVAPAAAAAALDAGYVVNAVAPDALRLAPPLVVTDDQLDAFMADLPAILDRVTEDAAPDLGQANDTNHTRDTTDTRETR